MKKNNQVGWVHFVLFSLLLAFIGFTSTITAIDLLVLVLSACIGCIVAGEKEFKNQIGYVFFVGLFLGWTLFVNYDPERLYGIYMLATGLHLLTEVWILNHKALSNILERKFEDPGYFLIISSCGASMFQFLGSLLHFDQHLTWIISFIVISIACLYIQIIFWKTARNQQPATN